MNPVIRLAAIGLIAIVAVAAAFSILRLPGSPVGAPASAPPSIEGTWQVAISHAEMLAAGLVDAEEDNTGNWGPFSLSIHAGTYQLVHLSSPQATDSGTYRLVNGVFTMTTSLNEVFSYPYTVTETELTFGPGGPVTMRVKPWTRVGP